MLRMNRRLLVLGIVLVLGGCAGGSGTAVKSDAPSGVTTVTGKWTGVYSYGPYNGTVELHVIQVAPDVRSDTAFVADIVFTGLPMISRGQLVGATVRGNQVVGTVAAGSTTMPFNLVFDGDRASGNIGQGVVTLARVRSE
jgi:hypothetical protein